MGRALSSGLFLLDTSTLIWALAEPKRLSRGAKQVIASGPQVLSVASYWEIVIKSNNGLLAIADPANWWERAVQDLGATVLSIRPRHVAALAALPDYHRDPFDRILVSQAIAEGLTLLASDSIVRRYPAKTFW